MAFSGSFKADSEAINSASEQYTKIQTNFSSNYEKAKADLEALKDKVSANDQDWNDKITKVINYLGAMDAALKTNATNLSSISDRVSEIAGNMQRSIQKM